MPTLREPKIMAGLFLVCIPLVIVGSLALYSLKSCINCSQAQLALLVPTVHPVSTVPLSNYGELVVAIWVKVDKDTFAKNETIHYWNRILVCGSNLFGLGYARIHRILGCPKTSDPV